MSRVKRLCSAHSFADFAFAIATRIALGQDSVPWRYDHHAETDTIWIALTDDDELREYRFIPDKLSTKLTSTRWRQTDPQWQSPWNRVFDLLQAKRNARVKCAEELPGQFSREATVAEHSSDSLHLFIGVNDPEYVPPAFINKVYVFRARSNVLLKEMRFVDDIYVADLAWSTDRKHVVMLLDQRKIRYSLRGIFRLLSGHPIPLHTFSLRVLNLQSGDIKDIAVCRDIEDGIAVIANSRSSLLFGPEPR
jgi:hypothetical protein